MTPTPTLTPEETINELNALMFGHDPDERNFCKQCTQRSPCLTRTTCEAAIDTIKFQQAIIDRLPKTADGVPVVPGVDKVWAMHNCQDGPCDTRGPVECSVFLFYDDDHTIPYVRTYFVPTDAYSTREACEAANRKDGTR